MTVFKRMAVLAATAMALGLSGCISLLPESEPSTLYRLNPTINEAGVTMDGQTIKVDRPSAPRALSGDRLAIEFQGGQIAYLAGVNWISPAPDLVQSLMIDTIDRSVEGLTASRPDDGVNTGYSIRSELRHFEAVYDNGSGSAPLVKVALRVRVVDESTRELLGVRTVDGTARADSNNQRAIVAAFNIAASEAAAELAAWASSVVPEDDEESDD